VALLKAAAKQIVTQRLKLPGAQWKLDGAILTAKARTAWMSGNWPKLVSARSLFTTRYLTPFACTRLDLYDLMTFSTFKACQTFRLIRIHLQPNSGRIE